MRMVAHGCGLGQAAALDQGSSRQGFKIFQFFLFLVFFGLFILHIFGILIRYFSGFFGICSPEKGGANFPSRRDLSNVKVSGQTDGTKACFGRFFGQIFRGKTRKRRNRLACPAQAQPSPGPAQPHSPQIPLPSQNSFVILLRGWLRLAAAGCGWRPGRTS